MIITREHIQTQSSSIQTIGYRQPNGTAEIERLMNTDPAMVLIDIRYKPYSQAPLWRRASFSQKYQNRYIWIPALGNINYKQPEKGIQIADPQAGIAQLLALLQEGHTLLLMCGCPHYGQCHRKTVVDLLQKQQDTFDYQSAYIHLASEYRELYCQHGQLKGENSHLREQNAELVEQTEHLTTYVDHLLDRCNDYEEEKRYHKELRGNAAMSGNQKVILSAIREEIRNRRVDQEGPTRFDLAELAKQTGTSTRTVGREIARLEKWNVIGRIDEWVKKTKKGRKIEINHISLYLKESAKHPADIEPTDGQKRNHGGKRERCQRCGSDNLTRVHHVRCRECGHERVKYPLTPEQEQVHQQVEHLPWYQAEMELPELPTEEVAPEQEQDHGQDDQQYSDEELLQEMADKLSEEVTTQEITDKLSEDMRQIAAEADNLTTKEYHTEATEPEIADKLSEEKCPTGVEADNLTPNSISISSQTPQAATVPTQTCQFCHVRRWTWYLDDQEWICLDCYSPASWSMRSQKLLL
jgi:hypothetical protein